MSCYGENKPWLHGGAEDGDDEAEITTTGTPGAADFVMVVTPEAQTRLDLLARAQKAEAELATMTVELAEARAERDALREAAAPVGACSVDGDGSKGDS